MLSLFKVSNLTESDVIIAPDISNVIAIASDQAICKFESEKSIIDLIDS